jgi:ribonuclease HI
MYVTRVTTALTYCTAISNNYVTTFVNSFIIIDCVSQTWLNKRAAEGLAPNQYSYVWNKAAFDSVNPATTDYLLG